ncbi:MAG TPA: hypothetical protein VEX38_06265, partial [Fimbriimonadaceae bacterium]|nr:hypothetical protein [Fimbriimonadaceae bacterium]
ERITLAENAPRANVSEFWFIRDKPKQGDKVEVYVFSLDTKSWELTTFTYKGLQDVTVRGKKMKAHKVESEKATAYMDNTGLPLRLESPQFVMERM